jgi:hypothetical protein
MQIEALSSTAYEIGCIKRSPKENGSTQGFAIIGCRRAMYSLVRLAVGRLGSSRQRTRNSPSSMRTMMASHQPSKLSSSSKPAARTSEPGRSWFQRSADIVADIVSDFVLVSIEVPVSGVAILSKLSRSATTFGEAGDRENLPRVLMTPSRKVQLSFCLPRFSLRGMTAQHPMLLSLLLPHLFGQKTLHD